MATKNWVFSICIFIISISNLWSIGVQDHPSTNFSQELIIPFHLVKKMIVVEAFVNGEKGKFIIDTGANSLVLNAQYFRGRKNTDFQSRDFSGSRTSFQEAIVKFGWDRNNSKTHLAIITSLVQLEEILGAKIKGYIGYEILKDYEVVLDYKKREMTLINLDKKGNPHHYPSNRAVQTEMIPLRSNDHHPYLTLHIGGKKLRFGIDSGATLNLISKKKLNQLNDYFQARSEIQTAGFNGKKQTSPCWVLPKVKLAQMTWSSMNFIAQDMGYLNLELRKRLDGLLGYEFLKQYKISLNYRKGEVYFWQDEILPEEVISVK